MSIARSVEWALDMKLRCESITPFAPPVVPEVKMMAARSFGSGERPGSASRLSLVAAAGTASKAIVSAAWRRRRPPRASRRASPTTMTFSRAGERSGIRERVASEAMTKRHSGRRTWSPISCCLRS
jgi:hypothetical protein